MTETIAETEAMPAAEPTPILLDRAIRAVCRIAAKGDPRPQMNGVWIRDGKAAAGDGYRLLEVELPTGDGPQTPVGGVMKDLSEPYAAPEAGVILPAVWLARALKAIPKWRSGRDPAGRAALLAGPDGAVRIAIDGLAFYQESTVEPIEGGFPKVDAIFPDPATARASFYMNPDLLAGLLQAVADLDPVDPADRVGPVVRIDVFEATKPLVISAVRPDGRKIRAAIMGMTLREPF